MRDTAGMARRRRSSSTATKIVRIPAPRAAAPVIRVTTPRASPVKRRVRRAAGRIGSFVSNNNVDLAIGGALYGFAVKQGWVQKLPAIPLVGRTGTAAILLTYWAKRGGGDIVRKTAIAASVLAGYQLGNTGAITGSLAQTAGDDGYPDD